MAGWREFVTITIAGVPLVIEQSPDGKRHRIRTADPKNSAVELTASEAEALAELPPDDLGSLLEASHHRLGRPQWPREYRDDLNRLRSRLPTDGLCVLLDTTTVFHATRLAGHAQPDAVALLDLALLAFAVVLFDDVVVLSATRASPRVLQEAFVELALDPRDSVVANTLWTIAREAHGAAENPRRLQRWKGAWAGLLGVPSEQITLDMDAYDTYTDSPPDWDGTIARHYATREALVDWWDVSRDPDERSRFLSIQTLRTVFNDRLGTELGVPYMASCIRSTVHAELVWAKGDLQLLTDQLVANTAGARPAGGDSSHRYRVEVRAPFVLGLALERMRDPEDLWPVLLTLRQEFAPLRKQLAKDRETWESDAGSYVAAYRKRLGDAPDFLKSAKTVVDAAAVPLVDPVLPGSSAVAKSLIAALPASRVRRLYWRVFRPEMHLLFRVQREAGALRPLWNRVQAIWGPGAWTASEERRLVALSRLQLPAAAQATEP
jgi:hypothetical protein